MNIYIHMYLHIIYIIYMLVPPILTIECIRMLHIFHRPKRYWSYRHQLSYHKSAISNEIPSVPWWLIQNFPMVSTVKSSFSYGFPMVFLWFSYGFPMAFLWFSYGFPMVFLWFSYGFPMVFLWFSYGFPMVAQAGALHFCGISVGRTWPWPLPRSMHSCWALIHHLSWRFALGTMLQSIPPGYWCLVGNGWEWGNGMMVKYRL